MVMAMTADGKIAKDKSQLADWTSSEDKQSFVALTKQHGAIMMGQNTFATFPAPLKGRLNVVFTKEENPQPIDGVKWVSGEPEAVLTDLENMGYKSVVLGGGSTLNGLFLERRLITEIYLTVEPKIFGSGLGLFTGDGTAELRLAEADRLNDNTLRLHYFVEYK